MEHTSRRHDIDAYRLRFSGRAGEYFRVWIVNLLLSVVTLGLYTPWARRRTARYFYDHTFVADNPLEFTAPLRKMVFGFLMFAMLYVAFNIASETGQDNTVMIFIIGAAVLAPYVWGSAMRFRLSNTRWRGLQLHFSARWKEVYLASWPLFVLAAVWVGIIFGLDQLAPPRPAAPAERSPASPFPELPAMNAAMWSLLAAGLVIGVLCIIRVEFNYKSLLVLRSGIGNQRGRWKPVYGDFVRIWVTTVGVFLLSATLIVLTVAGMVAAARTIPGSMQSEPLKWIVVIAIGVLTVLLAVVVGTAPARAYREARMFRLIWSNVGLGRIARFRCDLRPWHYVRLCLKNLLLTVVTLGLYRPVARVSEYRMKVDSVTLHVKGGLDQLVGQLAGQQGALGDVLADAVGLDLIG